MINVKPGVIGNKWDLCCGNPSEGESQADGFFLHDVNKDIPGLDLACNLLDLDKHLENNSVDHFRLSHAIEHFTIPEGKKILKMLFKLLKTDGKLTIIVPNFLWHAELLRSGQEEQAVYYCFGGQLDEYDIHKTAYTPTILKNRLQEAGFALISLLDESSITVEAIKP